MIERDYILRMIQQLTNVLKTILRRRDEGQTREALADLESAGERLLGARWKFVASLSDTQLIDLFGYERHPDKLLAAAELLRVESELLSGLGEEERSVIQGMKAFSLACELLRLEKGYREYCAADGFDALARRLMLYELPLPLRRKLFRYCADRGMFAEADEHLRGIVAEDPAFRPVAIAFYESLLQQSPEALAAGGISPEQIEHRKETLKP